MKFPYKIRNPMGAWVWRFTLTGHAAVDSQYTMPLFNGFRLACVLSSCALHMQSYAWVPHFFLDQSLNDPHY